MNVIGGIIVLGVNVIYLILGLPIIIMLMSQWTDIILMGLVYEWYYSYT